MWVDLDDHSTIVGESVDKQGAELLDYDFFVDFFVGFFVGASSPKPAGHLS